MNADEVVRALRWLARDADFVFAEEQLNAAADLIESQQAQLDKLTERIAREGFSDLETMIAKYKTVLLAANESDIEADEEIESLKAQLAERDKECETQYELLTEKNQKIAGMERLTELPCKMGDTVLAEAAIDIIESLQAELAEYRKKEADGRLVEMVRCGECRYRELAKVNCKGYTICPASRMEITDYDYCSYGERREKE